MTNHRYQIIRSPKHPGAIFVKVRNSQADFICKFYPSKETEAQICIAALEEYAENKHMEALEAAERECLEWDNYDND